MEYRNQYVQILREFLTAMADNVHCFDEDDDGVIFKGSPLYVSLLQSGSLAEELEVEQAGIDININSQTSLYQHEQLNTKKKKWDLKLAFLHETWKIVCNHLLSWLLPDLSPIYYTHHDTVIECLSGSSCLEEDDQDFLHFYITSSKDVKDSITTSSRISKLAFYSIPCLLSISVYQFMTFDVARQPFPWRLVLLSTVTPILILEIFKEARRYKHRKMCKDKLLLYNDLIKRNEKLANMVKKCLRLIQETELISRGFTLVSQRNPLSRLEGGQKDTVARQCPVLRKLVFTVAREAVLLFRNETKKLFDFYPLSMELDIQGSYLAYEPIQSYGPCLQTDIEDMDTLQSVTDGFSISALKGMTHLLSLHQSEFIKALILVKQERFRNGMRISSVEKEDIISSLAASLEELTVSLQKSHDYHSCAWMTREPVSRITRTQSNVEDIYIAVHSLDLHLQAALTRVKSLSDHIQTMPDAGLSNMNLDAFLDQMQPIRAELDSCKGCWEEGVSRIEKCARKNSQKVAAQSEATCQADVGKTQDTDTPSIPIEDYIIEDQVFQGYTDPDEILADYEWEKPLTAEEKEKKRKEKEEALRMLSELKKVISVRAVDTEKREKAAILKMYPDLKFSESSNPEESNMSNAQISSNQRALDRSCDQSSEAPPSGQRDGLFKEKDNENETNVHKQNHNTEMSECVLADSDSSEIIKGNEELSLDQELNNVKRITDENCLFDVPCDQFNERDKHSVISAQGVRRLRRSDMLEVSDSDSEGYPESNERDEHYGDDEDDDDERDCLPRLGLPLRDLTRKDESEGKALGPSSDEIQSFRLPLLTLEERLEHFSGANFGLASELAEKAVAKSKTMGLMEEATFGGDVYGECSSSNDEDDNLDHDSHDADSVNDHGRIEDLTER